jgi:hypothetical protein
VSEPPNELDEFVDRHPDLRRTYELIKSVGAESPRGMTVLVAAELDLVLHRLLLAYLSPGKTTERLFEGGTPPLGSLSAKVNLTAALDLITETEASALHVIREIRNRFAHRPGVSFVSQEIGDRVRALPIDNRTGDDAKDFELYSVHLIGTLEDAISDAEKRKEEELMGASFYRRGRLPPYA